MYQKRIAYCFGQVAKPGRVTSVTCILKEPSRTEYLFSTVMLQLNFDCTAALSFINQILLKPSMLEEWLLRRPSRTQDFAH